MNRNSASYSSKVMAPLLSSFVFLACILLSTGCSRASDGNKPSDAKKQPLDAGEKWWVFTGGTVGEDQLEVLQRNKNIRKISICDSQINDSCLDVISTLDKLTYLNLGHTRPINDDGLQKIAQLHNLKLLSLGHTGISDKGLSALTHLPNLRWLDLNGTQVSDEGLIHLANLRNLRRLTLHFTAVQGPGLRHLKDLTHLRELTVSATVDSDALTLLRKNLPHLKIQAFPVPFVWEPNRMKTDQ